MLRNPSLRMILRRIRLHVLSSFEDFNFMPYTLRCPLLLLSILAMLLLSVVGVSAQSTSFVGIGPVYSLPQDTFSVSNKPAFGGSLVYVSRKYCQLWPGVRINFTANQAREDTTRIYYQNAISISPDVRYFFTKPTEFPLYVNAMIHFGGISGTDSASRTGLGIGGGLGYLLHYDSDCCNWFLDLYAQYQAPNLILRSDDRPLLTSILLGLSFNLSL